MLCEFHGHHFPYAQRMLRDDRYKLVVNPEGIDELYGLELVRRGDRFSQWLAFMGDIPDEDRVRPDTAVEQHVG
ncbi:hypothetical protein [Jiangella muralis]|uniref:hypothetical protein n=1 Tax=Jiangella muralis TaxID=702383 RepID=UPI00069DB4D7|nr:hypothetical protein [Jiangella muralis]